MLEAHLAVPPDFAGRGGPALRTRYLAQVRDIAQRWLDWNTVAPLVVQYQTLI